VLAELEKLEATFKNISEVAFIGVTALNLTVRRSYTCFSQR
jgi:hypothetical protein